MSVLPSRRNSISFMAQRTSCELSRDCPSGASLRRWLSPNDHQRKGGTPNGHPQECPDYASQSSRNRPARQRARLSAQLFLEALCGNDPAWGGVWLDWLEHAAARADPNASLRTGWVE